VKHLADEDWRKGGFGLYLHWPFCTSKCPYCDFNSHVASAVDQKVWARAYLSEIERLGAETQGRILQTIYFGGGTPSLMEPELVATILEKVQSTWQMVNDPEITLEANPGSVEAGRFRGFREAGVNRISMGMQAMNDTDLRALGRMHSAAEAIRAFDTARSCFDRVSFDLIYARQNQSLEEWRKELSQALALAVDHLSLYQLTIEEGTVFEERRARGMLRGLPEEGLSADMYELTQELCDAAGMSAYEVSNHAKSGSESRHNLIYWRGGDYLGIGPGAHGRVTREGYRYATEAPKSPALWLEMAEKGYAELPRISLSSEERGIEYVLMSLRLSEGLEIRRLASISGTALDKGAISELESLGLISVGNERLFATQSGRMLLNGVIRKLVGA
jgi:putative oxygen-independent coproporphyrinogen III oxidase